MHEGEDYQEVQKIISINLLDFNLNFGYKGKPHRCFKLIYTKNHNIDLDFIQMHILEVQLKLFSKYKIENIINKYNL